MTLYPIEAGNFKLDGGAMFGVVPRTLWNKTNPADSNNMIDIAARCLLIEDGNKLTLIDTGMGNKQSEKFFGYYHKWGDYSLEASLKKAGFHRDDITDVFMTHLHFDHCGGSVQWNKNRTGYEPAFKNAHYWSNKNHWRWATKPNRREKASFLKENILPMQQSEQLKFIDGPKSSFSKENNNIDFLNTSALGFGVFFCGRSHRKTNVTHHFAPRKNNCFYGGSTPNSRASPPALCYGL
jgi:glyoxylase-like metal-dependent hydrolase (beta-lactamase superfamily II)